MTCHSVTMNQWSFFPWGHRADPHTAGFGVPVKNSHKLRSIQQDKTYSIWNAESNVWHSATLQDLCPELLLNSSLWKPRERKLLSDYFTENAKSNLTETWTKATEIWLTPKQSTHLFDQILIMLFSTRLGEKLANRQAMTWTEAPSLNTITVY